MRNNNERDSNMYSLGHDRNSRGTIQLLCILAAALVILILILPKESSQTPMENTSEGQEAAMLSTGNPFLHISEAMASNDRALPDENGLFHDWIELCNEGDLPINLLGYGLSDRETKILFVFPNITLGPGEYILVFASGEAKTEAGKTLHAKFKLSSLGESLTLFAPNGDAHETLVVPALGKDMSYAKTEDGFTMTDMYTPGYPNTQQGFDDFSAAAHVETGVLIINEILASNAAGIKDDDGEYHDWIEIYNASNHTIDLNNYALSDDTSNPIKWRFPVGMTIAPEEYIVVFASRKDRASITPDSWAHTSFGLSASAETVLLSDIHGRLIDQTAYVNLDADTSWGRGSDNEWTILSIPTPGLINDRTSEILMDSYTLLQNTSGIYITEVMTSNQNTACPDVNGKYDYIELYNMGGQHINLKDYGLSDNAKKPRKWQFPDLTIEAGQSLAIYCDTTQTTKAGSYTFTNYNLSVAGETIVLSDPSGNILDKLVVPTLPSDVSYGRTLGSAELFYYNSPSPGAINQGGFVGFAQMPTFVSTGGMYDQPPLLELNVPADTQVYYTTDATDPTAASALYTGPVQLGTGTTTIRARAYADDLAPSQIMTQTYFTSIYHAMPVIALTTAPDNLWNEDTGMLADGPLLDRDNTPTPWDNATYWKKLHYTGFIEYYDEDGNQQLSQGMNFHVMAQYSLDMPQKSFAVRADGQFGLSSFDYAFFDDRPFDSYRAIVLRNGGQDGKYTRVIDGLQHQLIDETDTNVITQAWKPVVVYLNGEYYGHYNLRERVGAAMLAQHHGWTNPNDLDILESDGTSSSQVNQGSNEDYKALVNYVKSHDLKNDREALDHVLSQVDVENMIDYFFFEMFYGNTDPGNIRFYRNAKTGDGKWRYVIYDLDWGLFDSKFGGVSYVLNEKGMGSYRISSNVLIRHLIQVPEIQEKFMHRSGQMFQTVFTSENMVSHFNDMIDQIQIEMQLHFNLWGEQMHPKVSAEQPKNAIGAYNYWITRSNRARNVMRWRPYIFWNEVQHYFALSDAKMIEYYGQCPPDNKEP